MSNPEDKKELEGLENEPAAENDALQKELEQIRSLFQDELDHAKNAPASEENEEPEAKPEETEPEELCACCGENPCDKSVSEDYEYCEECREAMKKYPISWKALALLVAVLACVLFATWDSVDTLPVFAKTLQAESLMRKNHFNEAAEIYYNLTTTADKDLLSKRTAEGQAKVYYKLGFLDDMITITEANFTEDDLKKPWNKGINEIYEKAFRLSKTADEVGVVITAQGDKKGADYPFDEVVDALNKYGELKETGEEKAVLAYYKYYSAYIADRPVEEQLKYLEEIKAADESQIWLYGTAMAQSLVSMGKYDEALKLCDEYGREFRDDAEYYAIRANVYRRQEQYEKALEQLDLGLKLDPESTSCMRQQAIVYLLKGQFDKAQDAAGEAYTLYPNSYETAYTYALTCLVNKDTEEYETVVSNLKDYEETMGQIVLDFKDGKVSLEQIFLEGKGDIL